MTNPGCGSGKLNLAEIALEFDGRCLGHGDTFKFRLSVYYRFSEERSKRRIIPFNHRRVSLIFRCFQCEFGVSQQIRA